MSFARYFKFSSYCLIGSGYVAIAATGTMDSIALAVFGCAFVASWFINTPRLYARIPPWVLNALAVAYVPFFFIDYRVLSHSFVVSTIHLVFLMAAVKILTLTRDRDYAYLYLVSFAELLAASTLAIDITFGVSFCVFLVSGVSTLTLFEIRKSHAAALSRGSVQPVVVASRLRGTGLELFHRFPAGTMFVMSIRMTLMILVLAAPIFLFLPRVTLGSYGRPRGRAQLLSGFSDTVELGTIGTIKESQAVVMRVRVSEPPEDLPVDLKWRGIALNHYDGRTWSRSNLLRYPVPIQGEYFKLERSVLTPNLLWQTFYLEALSTDVLFASHKVVAVSRDLRALQRDTFGNLYMVGRTFGRQRYAAASDPTAADSAVIASWPRSYPEDVKECCLQVPPEDPRIGELAKKVTDGAADPFGKARSLESYLRTHYGYSLDLKGPPTSKDPLAMFLFEVRAGHCEYFASAMAVMLREIGIPTRLVNGFRAGEYNRLGDDWTVRQSDAHSWVEAYFAPYGWVEFDPTPPDPHPPGFALARMLWNVVDAVDLWWWEDVVNYDLWKQYRLIGAVSAAARSWQSNAADLLGRIGSWRQGAAEGFSSLIEWRWLVLIMAAVAGASILLQKTRSWKHLRRFLRVQAHRRNKTVAVREFYLEALDLLASRGHRLDRGQTPLEFAATLRQHPASVPFAALTELYNRTRFGRTAGPDFPLEARPLLKSLKAALKSTTPGSRSTAAG